MISIFTTLIRSLFKTYKVTVHVLGLQTYGVVAREWVAYKPTEHIRSLS